MKLQKAKEGSFMAIYIPLWLNIKIDPESMIAGYGKFTFHSD